MSLKSLGRTVEATKSFERLQQKINERPPIPHTMTHRLVEEALELFGKATTASGAAIDQNRLALYVKSRS